MKKILVFLFLFSTTIGICQDKDAVDFGSKINNVIGNVKIDGANINPSKRFSNIKTSKIVLNKNSKITLSNCVVKVNGIVDATAINSKINLVNSYIICREYKGPKAEGIITSKYIKNCKIGDISYLKKIKGNPKIQIIDKAGKVVLSGNKDHISNKVIYTGVYDIRSEGNFYESDVLLANESKATLF